MADPINDAAVDQIIFNPIDANRSSTIQYLMTIELGYFRSAELAELGQAYNGGYPEVHFEILGGWLLFLSLPLAGTMVAWFLCFCIRLLLRNMIVSAILGIYVFYGMSLHFAGGMITFMLFPTYWAKIAVFLSAYVAESQIIKQGTLRETLERRIRPSPLPESRSALRRRQEPKRAN